jgi:hypothetical protein
VQAQLCSCLLLLVQARYPPGHAGSCRIAALGAFVIAGATVGGQLTAAPAAATISPQSTPPPLLFASVKYTVRPFNRIPPPVQGAVAVAPSVAALVAAVIVREAVMVAVRPFRGSALLTLTPQGHSGLFTGIKESFKNLGLGGVSQCACCAACHPL